MLQRFRHVIGELHPEQMIHIRAKRLFDAQRHFRRQPGLAVQKAESVARRTCKISAAFMSSVLVEGKTRTEPLSMSAIAMFQQLTAARDCHLVLSTTFDTFCSSNCSNA